MSGLARAVDPAEPLEDLVEAATSIVFGSVEEVEPVEPAEQTGVPGDPHAAQRARLRVDEVLRGDPPAGGRVVKPRGAYALAVGEEDGEHHRTGMFLLDDAEPPVILGHLGPAVDPVAVRRLVAGLPRTPVPPTDEDVAALFASADLVVDAAFAGLEGAPTEARAYVQEVLKGTPPVDGFLVQCPPEVGQGVEGWDLRTGPGGRAGVLFLRTGGDVAQVLNPRPPDLYQPLPVRRALGLDRGPTRSVRQGEDGE